MNEYGGGKEEEERGLDRPCLLGFNGEQNYNEKAAEQISTNLVCPLDTYGQTKFKQIVLFCFR